MSGKVDEGWVKGSGQTGWNSDTGTDKQGLEKQLEGRLVARHQVAGGRNVVKDRPVARQFYCSIG